MKSTVDEIRQRFDADVERFSNRETGQTAAVDAPIAMQLIAEAAAGVTAGARNLLDVGCGAGNFTLRLLDRLPGLDCTLLDLSRPMLDRAAERVGQSTSGRVTVIQRDIRDVDLGENRFDLIVAAAVLHHLRDEAEWRAVYASFYRALRSGGSIWVFDMVDGEMSAVREIMRRRYGEYLEGLKGESYRDEVFAYIEKEDTPRPLTFQLELMRQVGFGQMDVLHKHGCFAAFGGMKRD